jgi:hypothetical protein
VGHEVVQLAGDPRALLGDGLVRAQLLLALQERGARLERLGPTGRAAPRS